MNSMPKRMSWTCFEIVTLGAFTASEMGAHLATHHMKTSVLINYLVRRAQEAEDREIALRDMYGA